MSNKFTKEIVDVLNELLGDMNCAFRYELDTNDISGNPHVRIVPMSNQFVESYVFNLTKDYYEWLENLCKSKWGITLSYNNTRSTLWSKEGWK